MTYVTASFSGGKDSTAMVLHMIDLGEQIDEVINVDTGMEFPEMYVHIEKVRRIIEDAGIKYTVLKSDKSFEYYLLDHPYTSEYYGEKKGYGWPGPRIRWCTKHLKTELINDHLKEIREAHPGEEIVQCVGLAADEPHRIERGQNRNNRHPLAEWGWTEADALAYCKDRGYDWGGLYNLFKRVSCWCCPLGTVDGYRKLYNNRPELWSKLVEWDKLLHEPNSGRCDRPFSNKYTVLDLDKKFRRENLAKAHQTTLMSFEVGE